MTKKTNLRTIFPDAYARLDNEPMTEAFQYLGALLRRYTTPSETIDRQVLRHDAVWILFEALKSDIQPSVKQIDRAFDDLETSFDSLLKSENVSLKHMDSYRKRLETACKQGIQEIYPQRKTSVPLINFYRIGSDLDFLRDNHLKQETAHVACVNHLIQTDRSFYEILAHILTDFVHWRESDECKTALNHYARARQSMYILKNNPQSMRIRFQ